MIVKGSEKVENTRTGLVLEGGGMRGIYTAGVLDVLMEKQIKLQGVIGVSAGAIHGGTYVSEQRGRNIRYYKKYCNDKRFMSFRNLILTGEFVGRDFCYRELPEVLDPLDYETFVKNAKEIEYYVTCSNVETGKPEYVRIYDFKTQMDALRGSASLPYISKIVEYDGMKLLDGGCTDSIPVTAFRNMGFEKNVVVLTRHRGYTKKAENTSFAKLLYGKYPEFVNAMKERHNDYNACLEEVYRLEESGDVFVIQPSQPLEIGRMEGNPDKLQEVYDIGCKDATEKLNLLEEWLKS